MFLKKVILAGGITLGSAVLLMAGSSSVEAKGKPTRPKAKAPRSVQVEAGSAEKAIFGVPGAEDRPEAICFADCGNGWGWECSGASVSCTDGEGCTASSPGFLPVSGSCEDLR